jgi:hypothetical protein
MIIPPVHLCPVFSVEVYLLYAEATIRKYHALN